MGRLDFMRMLESMSAEMPRTNTPLTRAQVQKAVEMARLLVPPEVPFKVGDIIVHKEGLQNTKTSGPLVVTRTGLSGFKGDSGTPYEAHQHACDITACYVDKDEEVGLLEYSYDSRRMRLATDADYADPPTQQEKEILEMCNAAE